MHDRIRIILMVTGTCEEISTNIGLEPEKAGFGAISARLPKKDTFLVVELRIC